MLRRRPSLQSCALRRPQGAGAAVLRAAHFRHPRRHRRRRGLEDSLYIGPGKLAASNADQVAKIRRIIEELGYEAATPAEARTMLHLRGGDTVGF
jgi:hypothetical protein